MGDDTNGSDWQWSRRKTMAALSSAGVAGLAGCTGGNDGNENGGDGGDGGDGGGGGQPVDDAFTLSEWLVPKDAQYNSFNSKNWPGDASRMLYDAFVRYNVAKGEFEPNLLSDWSIDGKTVELKTRKQTWHDGDPVTAEDVVAQLRLEKYMGLTKYLESAKTTGEQSATLTLKSPVNPDVFLETFRNKRLTVKKSLYKEHLKEFENASGDEATGKAQGNLSNRTIDEPVGNGPFKLKNASSQQMVLTKFDDHPQAGNINFPKVVYKYFPSNQKRWQALMNNELDGQAQMFVPKNVREKFPDSVVRARIPTNGGFGVAFQHDHEHFGQQPVRQAVAHVIDRKTVASNSGGDTKLPVEIPAGIPGRATDSVEQWLGDSPGQFEKYQGGNEKAASLLKDAGFSKQNGTWTDSNGKPLKAPFKVPSGYTDWMTAAETIVSQLQSFGIDASVVPRNTATFWGKDFAKGNFVLSASGWSARLHSHPYFHLNYQLASSVATDIINLPETVEVPAKGGSGSTQVDVRKRTEELLLAKPGKETKDIVEQLAWTVNQSMPVLPIQEKLAQSFVTNDDWETPSADSDEMDVYWPTSWLPRTGALSAKTK